MKIYQRGGYLSFKNFSERCGFFLKAHNICKLKGKKAKYGRKGKRACKKIDCPRFKEYLKQGGIKDTAAFFKPKSKEVG